MDLQFLPWDMNLMSDMSPDFLISDMILDLMLEIWVFDF